jgi:hypothetical protein
MLINVSYFFNDSDNSFKTAKFFHHCHKNALQLIFEYILKFLCRFVLPFNNLLPYWDAQFDHFNYEIENMNSFAGQGELHSTKLMFGLFLSSLKNDWSKCIVVFIILSHHHKSLGQCDANESLNICGAGL